MAKKDIAKISLIAVALLLVFLPSFAKYQEFSYKNRSLERQINDLKNEVKALEIEKIRLQSDISFIEKRARDNIGVVRKGEIVLKNTGKK